MAEIGIYGMGTMGRALALNLASRGIDVAIANREADWIDDVISGAGALADRLVPALDLPSLIAGLAPPRVLLFMIPSGPPLDAMLDQAVPLLAPGDVAIDAGNADFHDTRRRAAALAGTGVDFVGIGVSGGAEGARHGPSMMVGGPERSWTRLRPMLEAIAARFDGDACVAHLGPDGAGHFVKTVHNGIEYADMQMIAEIYGLLRDGAGWDAPRIGGLFADWSDGPLASFLVDATARALRTPDARTGRPLVDLIRDSAGQKGTGRWTVIEALRLGQSASAIEAAVGARGWSSQTGTRAALDRPIHAGEVPAPDTLAGALLAGRILAHAQGFDLMSAAAAEYRWPLDLARIAEIWRAGCIIRSALLDRLSAALRAGPPDGRLIQAPALLALLDDHVPALRQTVAAAVAMGQPVPALSAALQWHDTLRRARGTANLIQAQRDLFGAHGFERIDAPGRVQGDWLDD